MGLIRLLLAISVIIAHSGAILGMTLVGGAPAVQMFFIISGFYMALILNEKYVGENYSYKLFIKSRLMRLMPTYWVVLAVALMTHHFSTIKNIGSLFKDYDFSVGLFTVFNNLFILGQDASLFFTINANGLMEFTSNCFQAPVKLFTFIAIPPAWSLSLEIMFYMMAPFICRLRWRYITLIFSSSAFIKYYLLSSGMNFDPWSHRFFPAELCMFVAGILAYKIYSLIKEKDLPRNTCKTIFFAIIASLFLYKFIPHNPALQYCYYSLFAASIPFIFKLTKKHKFDNFIANLSYPIYIVHVTILGLSIVNKSIPFHNELELLIILAIATVLYIYIDKPINEYRQTFIKKNEPEDELELKEATS